MIGRIDQENATSWAGGITAEGRGRRGLEEGNALSQSGILDDRRNEEGDLDVALGDGGGKGGGNIQRFQHARLMGKHDG